MEAATASVAPTPDSQFRNREGRLDVRALIALRREGLTLQQIGDLVGTTRERVRQILERVGFDPSVGPAARKAAVDREREETRWAELPDIIKVFVQAARRDGYTVDTGTGVRPLLRVDGRAVRVHRGSVCVIPPDRHYVRVTATDPEIVHLVWLPPPRRGWIRVADVSRARRVHTIPLVPIRGRWYQLQPVDLSIPGSTQVLLEEGPHDRGARRGKAPSSEDA